MLEMEPEASATPRSSEPRPRPLNLHLSPTYPGVPATLNPALPGSSCSSLRAGVDSAFTGTCCPASLATGALQTCHIRKADDEKGPIWCRERTGDNGAN